MYQQQRPNYWERAHRNGWVATVTVWGHQNYMSFAYAEDTVQEATWAAHRIADLTLAQRIADEHVPSHPCDCPGWLARN